MLRPNSNISVAELARYQHLGQMIDLAAVVLALIELHVAVAADMAVVGVAMIVAAMAVAVEPAEA